MSLVRSNRSQVAGKTRKKGKPVFKREWDNTISDLSVHRAGPEELARRRETHVSRNRADAQSEPRPRAAASGGPRRRTARAQQRHALTKLLFDQCQLHDVLTRSDCALAVVRDLFGDAPRRHAAFPNVTVAPGGGEGPGAQLIAQKSERPTQLSLLSESVMDSQALNETSCGKELEADCSVSVQHEAYGQPLEPKTPEPRGDRPQTSPTWSPDGVSVVHPGLNATAAIQRVKSRVESRTENDTDTSLTETTRVIRQVLHPGSSTSPKDIARDKVCDTPTKRMGKSRPEDRQIKLQEMIEKIDKELEEYERQTGYEVRSSLPEKGHGLTGFSFSLVSLISRLTRSLKECRNQQWQKENYQQLLQKSNHQQALIDALTAEFLSAQNKIVSLQVSLQQYVTKTDDELYSLKQMLHGLTKAESHKPRQNIAHEAEEIAMGQESLYSCAYPKKQGTVLSRDVPNVEEGLLQSLNQKQPCTYQNKEIQSLPEHSVGPAVLLSPPRQRNSQIATGSQTTVNLCHKSPLSSKICEECNDASQNLKEITVVPQGENYFAKHLVAAQNQVPVCQDHAQQQNICDNVGEHKNLCVTSPVINFPCMYPGAVDDTTTCKLKKMENNVEAEGSQNSSLNNWLKHEAMLTQITELQLQNSALKVHLGQFQVDKLSHPAPQIEKIIPSTSDSLQQRIAELNHQSAEARSKLLQLIEQQRQISSESVSPTISPIPSEDMATTATRTLEVLIPHPSGLDSSTGSTPSPANKINKNRSVDNTSIASSSFYPNKADGNRISVAQGTKPERLKEEGWFALSTHTLQFK